MTGECPRCRGESITVLARSAVPGVWDVLSLSTVHLLVADQRAGRADLRRRLPGAIRAVRGRHRERARGAPGASGIPLIRRGPVVCAGPGGPQ